MIRPLFPSEQTRFTRQCVDCGRMILRSNTIGNVINDVLTSVVVSSASSKKREKLLISFNLGLQRHLQELDHGGDKPRCAVCAGRQAHERYTEAGMSISADMVTAQIREAEEFYSLASYKRHEEAAIEVIKQTHRGAADATAH